MIAQRHAQQAEHKAESDAERDKARAEYRRQLDLERESLESYIAHAIADLRGPFTMDELRNVEQILKPHRQRLRKIRDIIIRMRL